MKIFFGNDTPVVAGYFNNRGGFTADLNAMLNGHPDAQHYIESLIQHHVKKTIMPFAYMFEGPAAMKDGNAVRSAHRAHLQNKVADTLYDAQEFAPDFYPDGRLPDLAICALVRLVLADPQDDAAPTRNMPYITDYMAASDIAFVEMMRLHYTFKDQIKRAEDFPLQYMNEEKLFIEALVIAAENPKNLGIPDSKLATSIKRMAHTLDEVLSRQPANSPARSQNGFTKPADLHP